MEYEIKKPIEVQRLTFDNGYDLTFDKQDFIDFFLNRKNINVLLEQTLEAIDITDDMIVIRNIESKQMYYTMTVKPSYVDFAIYLSFDLPNKNGEYPDENCEKFMNAFFDFIEDLQNRYDSENGISWVIIED